MPDKAFFDLKSGPLLRLRHVAICRLEVGRMRESTLIGVLQPEQIHIALQSLKLALRRRGIRTSAAELTTRVILALTESAVLELYGVVGGEKVVA